MKRLVAQGPATSFREAAQLIDVDLTPPSTTEVLVRVTHAGINGGCETFRTRAEFAFASNRLLRDFPLGAEGCGIVVAVGELVSTVSPGDTVAFSSAGAFSEYVKIKAPLCIPLPRPSPEAVALIISGTTACAALEVTAKVHSGDTVLITAAAGGTGHLAVQLAKLAGSHVIATCGGPDKAAALRTLGVDRVIDHTREDVGQVLAAEYPQGVSLVYEGVGGALREAALANLAEGGRLLQVGYISEYPHTRGPAGPPTPREAPSDDTSSSSRSSSSRDSGSSGGAGGSDVAPRSRSSSSNASSSGVDRSSDSSGREAVRGGKQQAVEGGAHGGRGEVPPAEELFWGNQDFQWGSRRIIGSIWPKDPRAVRRARRRVLQLYEEGQLAVWVDASHNFRGLEAIPDAVEHMLRGGHIGKVVVQL